MWFVCSDSAAPLILAIFGIGRSTRVSGLSFYPNVISTNPFLRCCWLGKDSVGPRNATLRDR